MASIYKRLSWGQEPITTNKLNDMVGNSDYLYDHSVTALYDVLGITRDSGISIRCGYTKVVNTDNWYQALGVYYTRPFLPGVRPVVLTSLAIDSTAQLSYGIKGLDERAVPDHRGFTIHLWQDRFDADTTRFTGDQWVSWLAIAPSG